MINSRSLSELHPVCKAKAEKFIELAKQNGIDLLVTSTYRDNEIIAHFLRLTILG